MPAVASQRDRLGSSAKKRWAAFLGKLPKASGVRVRYPSATAQPRSRLQGQLNIGHDFAPVKNPHQVFAVTCRMIRTARRGAALLKGIDQSADKNHLHRLFQRSAREPDAPVPPPLRKGSAIGRVAQNRRRCTTLGAKGAPEETATRQPWRIEDRSRRPCCASTKTVAPRSCAERFPPFSYLHSRRTTLAGERAAWSHAAPAAWAIGAWFHPKESCAS